MHIPKIISIVSKSHVHIPKMVSKILGHVEEKCEEASDESFESSRKKEDSSDGEDILGSSDGSSVDGDDHEDIMYQRIL